MTQGGALPFFMSAISKLKARAAELKKELVAIYLAAKHRETPWYAKVLIAAIIAYAMSPIDLVPDFIPVLGLLDDLLLLPLGIALVLRMVPDHVMAECRARASERLPARTKAGAIAAGLIVLLWLSAIVGGGVWAWRRAAGRGT